MNPEAPITPEFKRGPGRPRKEIPQPMTELTIAAMASRFVKPETHPTQSLGDLYTAIDSAPKEWLPSILAKVVKRSLKDEAWSSVENLILSVRGFSK